VSLAWVYSRHNTIHHVDSCDEKKTGRRVKDLKVVDENMNTN
jgi:hypothetical protein